jgi:hypothetical protein
VLPRFVAGNVRELGERAMLGRPPLPMSDTVNGDAAALELMLSEPEAEPKDVGENITDTEQ